MKQHLPIGILLLLNLIIGALTFSNYGESWDVNSMRHYADSSLSLYGGLFSGENVSPDSIQNELALGNYGPAFMMLVNSIERLGGSPTYSLQHLVYFVTFQIGVLAFYILCLRWMSVNAAFGTALLFSTQPVFWGHAFINPKDIPFLTFFLLSLLTGFRVADTLRPISLSKQFIASAVILWLIPFLIVFFSSGWILAWIQESVHAAAAGGTNIISFVASDIATAPPEIYIEKYSHLYLQVSFFYPLLSTLVLLIIFYFFSRVTFSALIPVVLAGLVLGFTIAIRNLGLFAGLIAVAYLFWKHRGKSLIHSLVYAVMAGIGIYLFWPYLWTSPFGRLVESVGVMSRYPWAGSVLFNGVNYSAANLPSSYLPILLGIQLTEPVWVLFIVGLAVAVIGLSGKRDLILLTAIWFILPLIGFIATRAILYDNFRQILFILPPVFFMAGVAFEQVKRPAIQAAVIALCVLPGIIGIVRLHPYEYIYYNSFIGGVNGAAEKFEMDYWATSFREAAGYVNEVAPANANVWVEGPTQSFSIYDREDLHVFSSHETTRAEQYDYVVATTRYDLDKATYPDAKIVFKITRGDAVLAVVKQP
jgi:hypothetical protein